MRWLLPREKSKHLAVRRARAKPIPRNAASSSCEAAISPQFRDRGCPWALCHKSRLIINLQLTSHLPLESFVSPHSLLLTVYYLTPLSQLDIYIPTLHLLTTSPIFLLIHLLHILPTLTICYYSAHGKSLDSLFNPNRVHRSFPFVSAFRQICFRGGRTLSRLTVGRPAGELSGILPGSSKVIACGLC